MNIKKDLRVGRWASIGIIGMEATVGRLRGLEDGIVLLQPLDREMSMLTADTLYEYPVEEIESYRFDYDINTSAALDGLWDFADEWNKD